MAETTLSARFREIALSHLTSRALSDSTGYALTYAQLLTQTVHLASWLERVQPPLGQYIGIFLPASVPAAIANYAITLSGRVAVNLNFTSGSQNCRAAVQLCDLRTILSSRAFVEKLGIEPYPEMVFLEDIPRHLPLQDKFMEADPHSTACILFSSGSTGTPKGIELTHWNILANAQGLASRIPPSGEDCVLGVLPFFHSFGYTFALWFPVLYGLRSVYHSNPTDCRIIGELANKHRATYFFSTPTFCQQYARKIEPHEFVSLRYILVGAEKLRESVAREFRSHFGIDLLAGYGCTELGPGVAVNTPTESKPGSVGRPLAGIEIRIVDPETFEPLPAGKPGIVLVNGPSRMPAYHKAPELTAAAILDGFYKTGDLGYLDEDGYLYITDRLARFSKLAGEMVPHLPIEEAISDLTPAFVTGVADDRRGERLVVLYTNKALSPDERYARLCGSGLPQLWIPKREDMHAIEGIPLLPTGKVDLKQARCLALALSAQLAK